MERKTNFIFKELGFIFRTLSSDILIQKVALSFSGANCFTGSKEKHLLVSHRCRVSLSAVKNVKTRDKNLIFKAKIMDLESVKSFLFLKKCAILLLGFFLYRTQTSVTHYACG